MIFSSFYGIKIVLFVIQQDSPLLHLRPPHYFIGKPFVLIYSEPIWRASVAFVASARHSLVPVDEIPSTSAGQKEGAVAASADLPPLGSPRVAGIRQRTLASTVA